MKTLVLSVFCTLGLLTWGMIRWMRQEVQGTVERVWAEKFDVVLTDQAALSQQVETLRQTVERVQQDTAHAVERVQQAMASPPRSVVKKKPWWTW